MEKVSERQDRGRRTAEPSPAKTSFGGKLNAKDFITIGVFTAINIVVGIGIAVPLGMIPIGLLLLSVVTPIVGGIIVMLYMTKIKKFGMLFIMSFINGLILLITGMGPYALMFGCVTSLVAEFIIRAGHYESARLSILAYGVMCISVMGNYVQWMVLGQDYVESVAVRYGMEFATTVAGYFTNPWIYAILAIACFVSGLIGGVLGRAVFKKHFERAGII